jgi:hypothetical protein
MKASENTISDFTEKQIRDSIIGKLKPEIRAGSKHQKGRIYLGEIVVARVKIPNSHKRVMYHSKSKHIAEALKLEYREFNDLVKCTLTGPQYFKILKDRNSKE